jgi:leader peptidase (prepilin peptidase)/N-methyltransferase
MDPAISDLTRCPIMERMLYLSPFLGLMLGVIVNLLSDSLPVSRSLERLHCPACGAPRPWSRWSALITRLTSAWRCAYCGSERSMRSWLVELFAVVGSLGLAIYNPQPVAYLPSLLVGFIFLLIFVIDIEHRLILHIVTLPAGVLFFLLAGLNSDLTYIRSLMGGAFGFILFFLLYLFGGLFSRWVAQRRGMDPDEVAFGFGDVTLATVIGLLVGFPAVIEALIRGILYAGLFSIVYLLYLSLRRRYSSFVPIPYGPFLILGALWVYFQGWTVLERLVGM